MDLTVSSVSGRFANNPERFNKVQNDCLKTFSKIIIIWNKIFWGLTRFVKMCFKISVRFLMDPSVFTSSGRISNNPAI